MKVHIYHSPGKVYEEIVKNAIFSFAKKEKISEEAEVSVSFVSLKRISELNQKYRQIKKPTDVLSFPIWDKKESLPKEGKFNLGDVFISIDYLKKEGILDLKEGTGKLVTHSLNHLIGKHH